MKKQGSHGAITFRDIEVVKKYSGATIVSIGLKILSLITLVVGIIISAIAFDEMSDVETMESTYRILILTYMLVTTLVVSTLLFACSYIVQILVDTEKHARRQLKLLWLQNKYCQDEYDDEEGSW